jgi:hypothetical protein
MSGQAQLLPGTLDLLILKALSRPSSWLWGFATHWTNLSASIIDRAGRIISGIVPVGAAGTSES